MSNRNRLGLTDLAGLRKPLVQTAELEKRGSEVSLAVPEISGTHVPGEVPAHVPLEVPPRILQDRKERKRLVSQSFKLPVELDELWSQVAAFNKVTKTGILLEALETFLQRLPQPPDSTGKG